MTEQQEEGVNLRVGVGQIIDQIHHRYSKTIALLVQENAESAAQIDMLVTENASLKSTVEALQPKPFKPISVNDPSGNLRRQMLPEDNGMPTTMQTDSQTQPNI